MVNYENTQNLKTLKSTIIKKNHPYQSISLIYFRDDKIQKSRPALKLKSKIINYS